MWSGEIATVRRQKDALSPPNLNKQRVNPVMYHQMSLDTELVIDNFAGGGGASLGIELALNRPVNIAINHDPEAVALHAANHPHTQHHCEDVWQVNPRELVKGRPVGLVWLSPDCKHFSKAKGGKPVEKKIRGLAWVALRWASLPAPSKPRVLMLENVEEFLTWGPIVDGKPCKKNKGRTFNTFVKELRKHGYQVEWRVLKACDYGAPTIRKRLFMIARCDGQPIVWPAPTHGEGLKPYRTAAECIDWTIPCPSIFERKRPLAENTMKRIARGLKKYVFDAQEPFIVPVGYGEREGQLPRVNSLNEPIGTLVSSQKHRLVVPYLTEHANASTQRNFDASEPLRTQCAQVKGGHFALCAAFLAKHFGGATGAEVDIPTPTILGRGTQTQIVTAHMARHFGCSTGQDMREPTNTLTAKVKDSVVTSHIMKMRGENTGHKMNDPLHTVSAGGCHHAEVRSFLLKYYGNEKDGQSLSTPLGSVTSKDRFGIVTIHGQDYQIVDIGMRMLTPRELYRAQGFPDDYKIDIDYNGKPLTKTAQVRMCGNSVCRHVATALVKANMCESSLFENERLTAGGQNA